MKAQTKAIVASVVVIALALAAVSGVTYSWFSDTESSDINVSSAKIDIDGSYTNAKIEKTSNSSYTGDLTTSLVDFTYGDKNLVIKDMVGDRTIKATYVLKNMSTVKTTYRMYVCVDGITDALANESISIKTTTTPSSLTVNTLSFSNGIAYAIGGASSGFELNKSSTEAGDEYTFTISIKFDSSITTLNNFSVKIVNEAYQSDFEYSEAQVIRNGSATMPTSPVASDITFKGTAPAEVGATPADVEVTFSSNAANTATNNGTTAVSLTTKMLAPEGSVAKIDLSLDGTGAVRNFGPDWVTVTVTIPEVYTDLKVYYNGSESEQPEILSITNDGSNTKVTFRTNHFSEFEILNNYINDEVGLKKALATGMPLIYVTNTITIDEISTLDLKGTTIKAASSGIKSIFNIECNITISNGKIINESSTVDGSRVLNIDGTEKDLTGISITLNDVDVIGPLQDTGATYTRGISFYKVANASLTVSGGSISANYYAINIASECPNFILNASNSNVSAGWCAYQTWSENTKATFTDCILQGTNDKSYNADGWNNFATIVYNEDLTSTELNLNNCTIKSIVVPNAEGNANKQYYMSIRSPGAVINVDNCTFYYSDGTTTKSYSDLLNTEGALQAVIDNVSFYAEAISETGPIIKIDGELIEFT